MGIRKSIESCRELGCAMVVLHLAHGFPENEFDVRLAQVLKSLDEIIPLAESSGVKLACENTYDDTAVRIHKAVFERRTHPLLGLCYDSSHANLTERPFEFLDIYCDRLFITHLSDNRGWKDDHLIPGLGIIDWEEVTSRIKAAGYEGPLLFEVERVSSGYSDVEPVMFTREAYRKATWVAKVYENI